jgi:flagellar biosynthetic protein FliO
VVTSGTSVGNPSLGGAALQLFLIFLALGFVIFLAWLTSRLIATRFAGARRSQNVRVLDQVYVGRERQLLVVEIAGRVLLIGSTPDNFSLLTEFRDAETVAQLSDQSNRGGGRLEDGFASILARVMGKGGAAPANPDTGVASGEQGGLGSLSQRIRQLRDLAKK